MRLTRAKAIAIIVGVLAQTPPSQNCRFTFSVSFPLGLYASSTIAAANRHESAFRFFSGGHLEDDLLFFAYTAYLAAPETCQLRQS